MLDFHFNFSLYVGYSLVLILQHGNVLVALSNMSSHQIHGFTCKYWLFQFRLQQFGLVELKVEGDGNCQVSCSRFLYCEVNSNVKFYS